jgi:hypothetical protein
VSGQLQQVHVRVNDAATGKPTPCRVRFTDAKGTYYAPFGRSTNVPTSLDYEIGGNVYVGRKLHAYIDGSCEVALPPGLIQVTVSKGPEYEQIDKAVPLPPGKLALRFELKRLIDPGRDGWHAGVMTASALSPHEVLLEGAAEGLRVVDLLAFERETLTAVDYPNLIAFSGQRPCVANSDCLVTVNTLNASPGLGSLALLNCHRPVFPLRFDHGKALESAPGNWTLVDWCDQCHRKRGLVIGLCVGWWEKWSGGEALADVILGKVDAVGLGELYVESIQWWYTLLSLGLRIPITAGVLARQLGLIGRTYARLLPGEDVSYANWIEALRAGRTMVSDGPLLTLSVNGVDPGAVIDVAGTDAVIKVSAEASSLTEFSRLEILRDGAVVQEQSSSHDALFHATLEAELSVPHSGWLAARCIYQPVPNVQRVAAHTSAVQVRVDHQPLPVSVEAVRAVTEALDRTLNCVQPGGEFATPKDRERLAQVFIEAKRVLASRMDG